jgi:predicted nucleic acid-binding protein
MANEIVVDTSVILAALLGEAEKDRLIVATRGANLCVPPSVPWEVGNVLSSLIKRRRLTTPEARRVARAFERIPLQHVAVDLSRSVQTAAELGLYAYDAYVLEAARVRRCGLLTLDRRLMKAARMAGVSLVAEPGLERLRPEPARIVADPRRTDEAVWLKQVRKTPPGVACAGAC